MSPEGYTISGRHSAHVANSAPSTFKLYCNGRIHFAQNFKTLSTISCAIFGKHTNTDIFFDCYFFKITIIFSSCKVINPASNPQPSFLQIISGWGAASSFYHSWRDPFFSICSLHGKMFHAKFIIVDYLLECSGWPFGIFLEPCWWVAWQPYHSKTKLWLYTLVNNSPSKRKKKIGRQDKKLQKIRVILFLDLRFMFG